MEKIKIFKRNENMSANRTSTVYLWLICALITDRYQGLALEMNYSNKR